MGLDNDRHGDRRGKSDHPAGAATIKNRGKVQTGENRDLGSALRSVYQRTINENIPPEMLDLLGKLD